jgi:hypothetical protein
MTAAEPSPMTGSLPGLPLLHAHISAVIAGRDPAIIRFERLLRERMDTPVKPAYDDSA